MQRNNTNRIAGWSLLEPWQTKGAMCWHNCWHSLALDCQTASPVLSRNVQTHKSPLKLRPYGTIQICLLLLLIHMHHASIYITAAQQHGFEREKYNIENQYEVQQQTYIACLRKNNNTAFSSSNELLSHTWMLQVSTKKQIFPFCNIWTSDPSDKWLVTYPSK